MIATSLTHIDRYRGLSASLDAAIDWLVSGAWKDLPVGRKDIDGDRLYALVQAYDSKLSAEARYEAHRAYLDIQVVLAGAEVIEVADVASLTVSTPYRPDVEHYATPEPNPCYSMRMGPGDALVLFPEDAHRPGLAIDGKSGPVKKLVLKIAI